MFEQRAYQRRVKRAGEDLYRHIWRNPHASEFGWEVAHAATESAKAVCEWPIDQLGGAEYREISDEGIATAVSALTWWLIVYVESYADPEHGVAGAEARAGALFPLADDIRHAVAAPGGKPVKPAGAVMVASRLLTGSEPSSDELAPLHPSESRLRVSLQTLAGRCPRAAARLSHNVPLIEYD